MSPFCSTMHTVRLPRIAFDIFFLLCLTAAAAGVKYGLEPQIRAYACNDESIRCALVRIAKDFLRAQAFLSWLKRAGDRRLFRRRRDCVRFGEGECCIGYAFLSLQIAVSEFHNSYVLYGLRGVRYRIGKNSRLQLNGVLVRFYVYMGWIRQLLLVLICPCSFLLHGLCYQCTLH